jgi:hypothetical protein
LRRLTAILQAIASKLSLNKFKAFRNEQTALNDVRLVLENFYNFFLFFLVILKNIIIFVDVKQLKTNIMKTEIKQAIINGENFYNEKLGWFTTNRINKDGYFWIFIDEKVLRYDSITKATNVIMKLINTGNI